MATAKPDRSTIDDLADDAVPPEYPDGAPLLVSWHQIRPRSRRAEFKRKFADFATLQSKIDEIKQSGALAEDAAQADRLRAWAELDEMYQQMDELMALAAVNPDAYREWSDEVDDDGLLKVWNVYMVRAQPGEASSSAS
ncbi:MAG: hypothetical protein L0I24_05040 [Pseudonocardia sp.]|nr:hypothetical protein [Pseudonocardia sp.]